MMRRSGGFSIVEMVVVTIVVIGLMALGVNLYLGHQARGLDQVAETSLQRVAGVAATRFAVVGAYSDDPAAYVYLPEGIILVKSPQASDGGTVVSASVGASGDLGLVAWAEGSGRCIGLRIERSTGEPVDVEIPEEVVCSGVYALTSGDGSPDATTTTTLPTSSSTTSTTAPTTTTTEPPDSTTSTSTTTTVWENHAPELGPIDDVKVAELGEVIVEVTAVDPDGDDITLTASGVPGFGGFVDNGDGTGAFTFQPYNGHEGNYQITVTVTDTHEAQDTQTFNLEVAPWEPVNFILNPGLEDDSYTGLEPHFVNTGGGGSWSRNTHTYSYDGTHRLHYNVSGQTSYAAFTWNGDPTDPFVHATASEGEKHRATLRAAKGSGINNSQVFISIDYWGGGQRLEENHSTPTTVTANTNATWQTLTVETDGAPVGTEYVVLRVVIPYVAGNAANLVFDAAHLTLIP